MNYAIILAGGTGSRFWPLSRTEEPKQLLNLCSSRPMVEETVERIGRLIPKKRIYIATNKILAKKIKRCAESLSIPFKNILFEPKSQNTFSPISCLAKEIYDSDPEAVITVLPCDHFIKKGNLFLRLLRDAARVAEFASIVTLGVRPKRPETGYGYIKIKGKLKSKKVRGKRIAFYEVEKFTEKPDIGKARLFLKDKRHYWNCGIFTFRASELLRQIKIIMPSVYKNIMSISGKSSIIKIWNDLPSQSIDYAVMERAKGAALLTADYGWMDLGSWEAMGEILKKDEQGNIYRGNCVSLGNKNTLVWSEKGLVASIGLQNIIVVNTEDALLVCRKDAAQQVKKIVQILKDKKFR
jgi:mannose-1-phosphate guanylyltransferase